MPALPFRRATRRITETVHGVDVAYDVPDTTPPPPRLPFNLDSMLRRILFATAVLMTTGAIVWGTVAIGSMLTLLAPNWGAYLVAGVFDAGWAAASSPNGSSATTTSAPGSRPPSASPCSPCPWRRSSSTATATTPSPSGSSAPSSRPRRRACGLSPCTPSGSSSTQSTRRTSAPGSSRPGPSRRWRSASGTAR
ncbi:hypothetical protein ACFQ51_34925 [Streptomyces kaempferi]